MTVFDIYLNSGKLCRAGVGRDGVLTAIVTWVNLTGPAAATERRLKKPVKETRLHVGGLRDSVNARIEITVYGSSVGSGAAT